MGEAKLDQDVLDCRVWETINGELACCDTAVYLLRATFEGLL